MAKIRQTVNRDEDILVYYDDDYLVYKKYGQISGSLLVEIDLLRIAIDGIENNQPWESFKDHKDINEILDKAISKLSALKQ